MSSKIMNINCGIVGHVDAGKTSLVKALSTHLSTASLDKHPQSRDRGMTLDLGFSSLVCDVPKRLREAAGSCDKVQFTFVDCPGHASLIKTIMGGAQIIDMVILVIDALKGVQTQTSECIVIGEVTTDQLVVVLNKVDMIEESDRDAGVKRITAQLSEVLKRTRFKDAPIVPVSACLGGEKRAAGDDEGKAEVAEGVTLGLPFLVDTICERMRWPQRQVDMPFYFSIDHCFTIKGVGTIMTGTVVSGAVEVNQNIEMPQLGIEKKVKSMQMFHTNVERAVQGDRVGICVTNFDAKLMERGIAAEPGSVPVLSAALVQLRKVRFFRGAVATGTKVHITLGHTTVMATVVFFGSKELAMQASAAADCGAADGGVLGLAGGAEAGAGAGAGAGGVGEALKTKPNSLGKGNADARFDFAPIDFDWDRDYEYQDAMLGGKDGAKAGQWALLRFDHPIHCPLGSTVLGSRLDTDVNTTTCRIAFFANIVQGMTAADPWDFRKLRIYKNKSKEGTVDRAMKDTLPGTDGKVQTLIGKDLFKKETDIQSFLNMRVETESGEVGSILSGFGNSGKFKVVFKDGTAAKPKEKLVLRFKKYIFDNANGMHQDAASGAAKG